MLQRNALHKPALSLVAAVLFAACTTFGFAQQDSNRVDTVSNKGFDETLTAVRKTLESQGFMIVNTVDHQNMLKMVGANLKGATTIEFGKPEMGKMMLPMAPQAGLEMPARFYVWERNDGKTVISYRKPSAGFATYGDEMIAKMGQDMDGMWAMMAEEAAK